MTDIEPDTPFMQGYNAFLDGDLVCAYRLNSHYNREWHRGFNTAFFKNGGTNVQSIPENRF